MAVKKIIIDKKTFDISYEIKNINKIKNIIFLHGWGSNKELMSNFFGDKFDNFKHIYIDLPGFGNSSNRYNLNSFEYAKIIDKFLDELNITKDIAVGHSFGGKIATLLEPTLLVLLSTAGIVETKSLKTKIKIFVAKLAKKFKINISLLKSKDSIGLSPNMYETFKNVVDEDFSDIFGKFKNQAIIFWGKQDEAVSLNSGKKINKLIKKSLFFPLDGEHYFYFNHSYFIEKILLSIQKEIDKDASN